MQTALKWVINSICIGILLSGFIWWIVSLTYPDVYQMFHPTTINFYTVILPLFLIPGIFTALTSISLLYMLYKWTKVRLFAPVEFIYKLFSPAIYLYHIVLVPFLLILLVMQWLGSFLIISPGYLFATLISVVVFEIFLTIVWFHDKRIRRLSPMISGMLLLSLIAQCYFFYIIYSEFQPHYYGTFPLDDPNGIYLINYDGDYWLTYYIDTNDCAGNGNSDCTPQLEKKGNTSIEYSPENLNGFIAVPVQVTGTFTKIHGPITTSDKRYCFKNICAKGKGPGIWYNSPLRIETIKLVESDK